MHALRLEIGKCAKNFADNSDQRRQWRQERHSLSETKKVRKDRREQLIEANKLYEKTDSLLYEPGIAD